MSTHKRKEKEKERKRWRHETKIRHIGTSMRLLTGTINFWPPRCNSNFQKIPYEQKVDVRCKARKHANDLALMTLRNAKTCLIKAKEEVGPTPLFLGEGKGVTLSIFTWIPTVYSIRTVLNSDIFLPPPNSSSSAVLQYNIEFREKRLPIELRNLCMKINSVT